MEKNLQDPNTAGKYLEIILCPILIKEFLNACKIFNRKEKLEKLLKEK